jgi:hypothetical protein
MPYPINETFNSGIPVGFASIHNINSATYNAAQQAVDLNNSGGQGFWQIDATGLAASFSITAVLEIVSANSLKHFGLWLTNDVGANGTGGIRFAYLYDKWSISQWGNGFSGDTSSLSGQAFGSRPEVAIGQIVALRVEYCPAADSNGLYYVGFFVDDVLVCALLCLPIPRKVGIFLYECTVRLHSIVGSSPSTHVFTPRSTNKSLLMPYRHTNPIKPPVQVTMLAPQKVNSDAFTKNYRNFTRWQAELSPLAANYNGVISGLVTIQSTVAARKVRLYNKSTGQLVGQVMSGTDGAYTFTDLDPSFEYFAVGHDHTRVYNAVIQDMIQP